MTDITPALQARLSNATTTLCHCWRLRRKDGFEIGLTDHDRPVSALNMVFNSGASVEAGRFTQTSDLRPGQAAAGGVLSSDAISESDLEAGYWDRAQVDVFIVDWDAPDLGAIPIWSGLLSEVTYTDSGTFEASLVSLKADLEQIVGRVIKRHCDASLGDTRCGLTDVADQSCDQRYETCRDVFDNVRNFRGFPHLPGPDFVLAGPGNGPKDGGKR